MKKRIYVVTGNHNEFMAYKLLKDDYENTNYVYVSSTQTLRGIRDPQGVFYGSWRRRDDILEIVEQLRISHSAQNAVLDRIWAQIWKSSTHAQINQAAVNSAAQRMADDIDAQVLSAAIGSTNTGSYTVGSNGAAPPSVGAMRLNSYIDKMEVYDGMRWNEYL